MPGYKVTFTATVNVWADTEFDAQAEAENMLNGLARYNIENLEIKNAKKI